VTEALGLLVTADRVIINVGWVDAETLPGDIKDSKVRKVERELADAESDFAEGDAHRAAGRYEDAIKAYRGAWEHLEHAFKEAGLR
jgi:hypothetical protein